MSRLFTLLIAAALGACTPGAPPPWINDADGSTPSMSDVSDCRAESKRQAELRYPSQPMPRTSSPGDPVYKQQDPDRFPAEIRFFELCMQR